MDLIQRARAFSSAKVRPTRRVVIGLTLANLAPAFEAAHAEGVCV